MEPGRPSLIYPNFMIHARVLDDILGTVRRLGWDLVSIDEVYRRLVDAKALRAGGNWPRRFACFTCDEGCADDLTGALPVFRKHGAPLCVYIATGFLERSISTLLSLRVFAAGAERCTEGSTNAGGRVNDE